MTDTETTTEGTTEEPGQQESAGQDDQETFTRDYVEKLRQESAGYRERAKGADDLRHKLFEALVKLDGRLADPTDLTYSDEHLDDISGAVTDLIERKPHLARKPQGDVGQGVRSESAVPTDFSGLFRRV